MGRRLAAMMAADVVGQSKLMAEGPAARLTLRIGINLGDVVIEGGDIHGDGVNVAARLETLAEPGGICVSAIDPDFAAAYAGIAKAEGMSVWDLSTYDDSPLARSEAAGKRALELDPNDYRSHLAYGAAMRQLGRHALARQHLKRAMTLNPNSAEVLGDWAMLQAYTGDPEGAIGTFHRAIRLDPFSEEHIHKEILAESHYMLRNYRESIAVLEQMLKLPIFYHHQQIAIAHAQLGETEAAARHMAAYRASLPPSYDERLLYESHLRLCAREEDRAHWRQGYRLIGMDV